jgi:hypothetical protein
MHLHARQEIMLTKNQYLKVYDLFLHELLL